MDQTSPLSASGFSTAYPSPPRVHWGVLLVAYLAAALVVFWVGPGRLRDVLSNVFVAAWPIYLAIWIRRIDAQSQSLYWVLASFATGFLFSWLLWIVVIFEVREELLLHYNRREPVGLRLNLILSLLFSFIYFQYQLNAIAKERTEELGKAAAQAQVSSIN